MATTSPIHHFWALTQGDSAPPNCCPFLEVSHSFSPIVWVVLFSTLSTDRSYRKLLRCYSWADATNKLMCYQRLTHLSLWASQPQCMEIRALVPFRWNRAICSFCEQLSESSVLLNEWRRNRICLCFHGENAAISLMYLQQMRSEQLLHCRNMLWCILLPSQVSARVNGDKKSVKVFFVWLNGFFLAISRSLSERMSSLVCPPTAGQTADPCGDLDSALSNQQPAKVNTSSVRSLSTVRFPRFILARVNLFNLKPFAEVPSERVPCGLPDKRFRYGSSHLTRRLWHVPR